MSREAHQRENDFRQACWGGVAREVYHALDDWKIDIDVKEKYAGVSGLHMAAEGMQPRIVQLLVERGCDIDIENNDGENALITALKEPPKERGEVIEPKRRHAVVQILLKHGISKDSKAYGELGSGPLHLAANLGDLVLIQSLVDYKCDVNAVDKSGRTAMHYAAAKGKVLAMQLVHSLGGLLQAADSEGFLPFHVACDSSQLQSVQFILDTGGHMSAKTKKGDLGAHLAARHKTAAVKDVVEYLISLGADLETKDRFGKSLRGYCKDNSFLKHAIANGRALAKRHGKVRRAASRGASPVPSAMSSSSAVASGVGESGAHLTVTGSVEAGVSAEPSVWASVFASSSASALQPSAKGIFTKGHAADGFAVLDIKGEHIHSGTGTRQTNGGKVLSGQIGLFEHGLHFQWKTGLFSRTSHELFLPWKPTVTLLPDDSGTELTITFRDGGSEEGVESGAVGDGLAETGEVEGGGYFEEETVYVGLGVTAGLSGESTHGSSSGVSAMAVGSTVPLTEDAFVLKPCRASEMTECIQREIDKMFPTYSSQRQLKIFLDSFGGQRGAVGIVSSLQLNLQQLRDLTQRSVSTQASFEKCHSVGDISGAVEMERALDRIQQQVADLRALTDDSGRRVLQIWEESARMVLSYDKMTETLLKAIDEMVAESAHWKKIGMHRRSVAQVSHWRRLLVSIRGVLSAAMPRILGLSPLHSIAEGAEVCVVCRSAAAEVTLSCGHTVLCHTCTRINPDPTGIKMCPVCRLPVEACS